MDISLSIILDFINEYRDIAIIIVKINADKNIKYLFV